MAIETLDDWNERLGWCGCCEMPDCPAPTAEWQSKEVLASCGYLAHQITGDQELDEAAVGCADRSRVFRHVVRTETKHTVYSDGTPTPPDVVFVTTKDKRFAGSGESRVCTEDVDYSGTAFSIFGSITSATWSAGVLTIVWTYLSPPATITYTLVTEFSDEWTIDDWETEAATLVGSVSWSDEGSVIGSTILARRTPTQSLEPNCGYIDTGLWEIRGRYRWTIPAEHAGSYFLTEWDEVFFPDPDNSDPVVTPKSWEWTGGDTVSPWSSEVVAPAGKTGVTRLRNVRFICYRSPFGQKPSVHPDFESYTQYPLSLDYGNADRTQYLPFL